MSRTEPAQGNQKLMEVGVPALPVELTGLNSPVDVGEGSVVVQCPIHERDYCIRSNIGAVKK